MFLLHTTSSPTTACMYASAYDGLSKMFGVKDRCEHALSQLKSPPMFLPTIDMERFYLYHHHPTMKSQRERKRRRKRQRQREKEKEIVCGRVSTGINLKLSKLGETVN